MANNKEDSGGYEQVVEVEPLQRKMKSGTNQCPTNSSYLVWFVGLLYYNPVEVIENSCDV